MGFIKTNFSKKEKGYTFFWRAIKLNKALVPADHKAAVPAYLLLSVQHHIS